MSTITRELAKLFRKITNIEEYMQKWDAERAAAAGKGE